MATDSTPLKYSPLYAKTQEAGGQFITVAGWQIPQVYSTVKAEMEAARQAVALVDRSAGGKLEIAGTSAEPLLRSLWPELPELDIGRGAPAGTAFVYRLRRDLYFIEMAPGEKRAVEQALTGDGRPLATVTDVTHGRSALGLAGPKSAELLSRLCGLDFHPAHFPNLCAQQSSVAKTRQLIIRRDMPAVPAYILIGARSLAAYLWDTILEAGGDLGITPMGLAALGQL